MNGLKELKELLVKTENLVREAAEIITSEKSISIFQKGDKDFVTQVDQKISAFLCRELLTLLPDSRVISEEESPRPETGESPRWIIDPIDGTSNFIYGLPLFVISVGLVWREKPVLGIVFNPAANELFSAAEGNGAFLNGKPIKISSDSSISKTLLLLETNPYAPRDTTRTPSLLGAFFSDCIDCRITGSAALDMCYIAAGRGGAFVAERLAPWDYCGGAAILAEAGGCFSRWDGTPTTFNVPQSIAATNALVHAEVCGRLAAFL